MQNAFSKAIDVIDKIDTVLNIPEWAKKLRGIVVSIGTVCATVWIAAKRLLLPQSNLGVVGLCAFLSLTASISWAVVELIYWRIKQELVSRKAHLIVHSAEYGVEGEEPWKDVTLRVRSYITSGNKISFRVSNSGLVAKDPHDGALKLLRVTYSFMEVSHKEIVRAEGDEVILP